MSQIYLVTGANSGLGLDTVRRLAMMPTTQKVYMTCRSQAKAQAAMDKLQETHKDLDITKLHYVHFDASATKQEIDNLPNSLDAPLNGIILNAGGTGHDTSKKPVAPNQVLNMHQINLIGHIQLVEALKTSKKLADGCHVIYAGSEVARGVPMMMVGNFQMGDSPELYQDQLEGKFAKYNYCCKDETMRIYAKTKGFAALYFAEWARRNPHYTALVVSPGGTLGTDVYDTGAMPLHLKLFLRLPGAKSATQLLGLMHPLEAGTDRYIQAVTGEYDKQLESGTFVASQSGTTGPVSDQKQSRWGNKYGDVQKQKAAFEALSKYTQ